MPIVDAVTPPSSPRGYHYEIVLITASTTLTENHRDRLLQVTGTVTITLPNDLPVGFHCKVERYGSGAVTLSAASGATLNNAFSVSVIESRYEVAEIYVTANGNGLAAVYNVSGLSTATADELNVLDGLTATTAELNYNDIATLGTGAASKAVVLDAGEDYTWPNTGVLTLGVLATAVEAAEHGAGAIGTAVAPATYRWIEHGVIVTQIKFDLTGLASVATADDVIGLAAGGAAYIGRNVVATNGVIFKTEFSCIETPAGGDNDVNVVVNASAVLAYDGAGGTTYLSNSGDLLAGQTVQNLVPAITANDYIYLTAGTGDTAATYTAGMYVLTLYGHALLA